MNVERQPSPIGVVGLWLDRNDLVVVIAALSYHIDDARTLRTLILAGLELGSELKIDRLLVESNCAAAIGAANSTTTNLLQALSAVSTKTTSDKSLFHGCSDNFSVPDVFQSRLEMF